MDNKEVKLRGHHLLCILTYIGRGYTDDFVKVFDQIVDKINQGSVIRFVRGEDDICAGLHADGQQKCDGGHHCFSDSVAARDDTAFRDVGRLLGQTLNPGESFNLTHAHIGVLRQRFADRSLRTACKGCEWYDLCSGIAASGYMGVKLHDEKHVTL